MALNLAKTGYPMAVVLTVCDVESAPIKALVEMSASVASVSHDVALCSDHGLESRARVSNQANHRGS